jgi:hypothetical protein
MEKIKSVTDIEQGKKLLELSIDPNTADYHWWKQLTNWEGKPTKYPNQPHALSAEPWIKRGKMVQGFETFDEIPAWSVPALMELLPSDPNSCWELTKGGWEYDEDIGHEKYIEDKYFGLFEAQDGTEFECRCKDTLLDAAYTLVEWWVSKKSTPSQNP